MQTTAIDKEAGLIHLTTTLAHVSGERLSSEWSVCPIAETAAPRRTGAALTYARRYALFTAAAPTIPKVEGASVGWRKAGRFEPSSERENDPGRS